MSEIRYKDFKNKVDLTKPYDEQAITLTTKFSESEFEDFKNRAVAEAITKEGTIGSGAASAVDLSQDNPEVNELVEEIAGELELGFMGPSKKEKIEAIKKVQEGKRKGLGITDILKSLPPDLRKEFELSDISQIDKFVEDPVGPGGLPLTADLAGGIFGVPSVSDQLRAQQAQREAALAAFNPGQIAAIGNVLQGSPGFGMGINPVLSQGPSLPSAAFEGIPAALRTVDTANLTALNADLNEDGVVDELDEQIKVSQMADQPFVPGVSFRSRPTETRKSGGIGDLLRFIISPGSFLLENLPGRQYDMTTPLTARLSSDRRLIGPGAAVSGGIYSARNIGGGQTNTPFNLAADFYDPTTGKTRFDRSFDRFLKTGKTRDLLGAARSGAGARRLLRQAQSGIIRDAAGRNVIIPGRATDTGGRGPGPGGIRETDTGGFGQADFGNRSDDKFGAL